MELERILPELADAPDLAWRGLEKVWSPEKGDWIWVPVYELSGPATEADSQGFQDS